MKPHQIAIYFRHNGLYVQPSLPSSKGMRALDCVESVSDGWAGLPAALSRAEAFAVAEAGKRPQARRFAGDTTLPDAAGCRSFGEFADGTTACILIRVPDYVLVMRSVGDAEKGVIYGTPRQDELPPDTPLDELARIARNAIEGRDGW